jgi:MtN3 and saliva related transmembrane protein
LDWQGAFARPVLCLPQVIKTIKEKKADDVSLGMLMVLQAGLILWIIYGFKKTGPAHYRYQYIFAAVNILMVVLRQKYRKKD